DQRISHLSYEEQKVDLEPTIHRGIISKRSNHKRVLDRFEQIKEIKERNYEQLLTKPEVVIDLLTYHDAVFNHHALAKFVNKRTSSAEEFEKLMLKVETSSYLVKIGKGLDGKEYYTSQKVLEQERSL